MKVVLSVAEGECQLMLVVQVDRDCLEPGGDVQLWTGSSSLCFGDFLVQTGS